VVVGLALPGTPPKTSDSVAKVTRTLLDHRSEFLASSYVLGLGCLLLLVFMDALRSHLGRDDALGGSAFGAGIAGVVLLAGSRSRRCCWRAARRDRCHAGCVCSATSAPRPS
jgi:hypothetical protein